MQAKIYKPKPTTHIRPARHVSRPSPYRSVGHSRRQPPQSSLSELANTISFQSYIITKGVLMFGIFYGTMNWWYYKRTREEIDKDQDTKNDD